MPSGTARCCAGDEPPALRLDEVSYAFGRTPAVEQVTLEVDAGSFFALLGSSGCGKTTLLRLIGGYITPAPGRVEVRGRDVTALPPERRNVGMVFQSYALFPHLTARGNVSFGLEMRGVGRAERERRVEEVLDRVGLSAAERGRKPGGLSGGQQQRVALARALVIEPDLLLLDEPLANLDRRLREQVRGELRQLQRRAGVTAVLVTHDPEEALSLADRVGVMAGGRLLQVGPPRELYERPVSPYVATLLGDANILRVEGVSEGGLLLEGGGRLRAPELTARARPGDRALIRPAHVRLCPWSGAGWSGRVVDVAYRGEMSQVTVAAGARLLVACRPDEAPAVGQEVGVDVAPEGVWLLPDGGAG